MISLLSTVVAPEFVDCKICVEKLDVESFLELLTNAEQNFCGHPLTWGVLKQYVPELPDVERGTFWDGDGFAIAARPKGGRRGGQETEVTLNDLEFCKFWIEML
jgi:hypothetical protein